MNMTILRRALVFSAALLVADTARAVAIAPSHFGPVMGFGGNYYQLVEFDERITWHDAVDSAAALSYSPEPGVALSGHLGTITSQAEQVAVESLLPPEFGPRERVWLGGSQNSLGPEPDGGWSWITGEDWDFTYWDSSEPNNSPNGEDFLNIKVGDVSFETWGRWNDDLAHSPFAPAYGALVEFEGVVVPEVSAGPIMAGLICLIWVVSRRIRGATVGSPE